MSCNILCGGRLPYSYNPQGTLQNLAIARSVIRQEEPVRVIIQLGLLLLLLLLLSLSLLLLLAERSLTLGSRNPKPKRLGMSRTGLAVEMTRKQYLN